MPPWCKRADRECCLCDIGGRYTPFGCTLQPKPWPSIEEDLKEVRDGDWFKRNYQCEPPVDYHKECQKIADAIDQIRLIEQVRPLDDLEKRTIRDLIKKLNEYRR